MAGLKLYVNNLIDKKLKPVSDAAAAASADNQEAIEEIAGNYTRFFSIASTASISATSATITVSSKTITLKPGDFIHKQGTTPQLWLCVAVTSQATTNIQIDLT